MQAINQEQYKAAVNELEQFIEKMKQECAYRGWGFWQVPEGKSPESFEALKFSVIEVGGGKNFPVLADSCDQTIYSKPEYNVWFRFWHDVTHLELNLGFGFDEEIKVAGAHLNAAREYGLSSLAQAILKADTVGQVTYYYQRKEFVENQEAFVMSCLQHGIPTACRLKH